MSHGVSLPLSINMQARNVGQSDLILREKSSYTQDLSIDLISLVYQV